MYILDSSALFIAYVYHIIYNSAYALLDGNSLYACYSY